MPTAEPPAGPAQTSGLQLNRNSILNKLYSRVEGEVVELYVNREYIGAFEVRRLAKPSKTLIKSVKSALKRADVEDVNDADVVAALRLIAKNGGRIPDSKEEVERRLQEVIDYARLILETKRLEPSPWADAVVLKRDKATVDDPEKANAVAIIPAKVSQNLAVIDVDSEEALKIIGEYLDINKSLRVLAGPLVDAQKTPEGKWRTPDGRVLDAVERKLHIPVYIPEGCRGDQKAPGIEVKCNEPINMAGLHPSGAQYELVDGELAILSWDTLETILSALGGEGGEAPPRCTEARPLEKYDEVLDAFRRIYAKAQAFGYTRHDSIYDLASLARRSCIAEEYIIKIVEAVYGSGGEESQTLSQRKGHVRRAYREGAKIRSRARILEKWREIDAEAAEVLAKIFKTGPEEFSICIAKTEERCLTELYGKLTDGGLEVLLLRHGEEGAVSVLLYRGPALTVVEDPITKQTYYRLGDLFAASTIDVLVEKLKMPNLRGVYVDVKNIDKIKVVFDNLSRRETGTYVTGLLPAERGLFLNDPYGVIAKAPTPAEAVAELDKALRSVAEAYPAANRENALATVGYILALNIAPAVWSFRPHLEVPIPLIYGASRLGKSKLVERIIEPAIFGAESYGKLVKIWTLIKDREEAGLIYPKVLYPTAIKSDAQLRNLLMASSLVAILDEQLVKFARVFGDLLLQISTARWGEPLQFHASRYGLGAGAVFYRLRAIAIVTNNPPQRWLRALEESASIVGAVLRRLFFISWENVPIDLNAVSKLYSPRWSILPVLVDVVNRHFEKIIKEPRNFFETVIRLYEKIIEDFEGATGRLEGMRAMVEALKVKLREAEEENRVEADPVRRDFEELRRNAYEYVATELKTSDLSPAKVMIKLLEAGETAGLKLLNVRYSDEVMKMLKDFCEFLEEFYTPSDFSCEDFAERSAEYDQAALAMALKLDKNSEEFLAVWTAYRRIQEGKYPAILAKSPLWPANTRRLGDVERSGKPPIHYYKLNWGMLFRIIYGFSGKIREEAFTKDKDSNESQAQSAVSTVSTVSTGIEEVQKTSEILTPPSDPGELKSEWHSTVLGPPPNQIFNLNISPSQNLVDTVDTVDTRRDALQALGGASSESKGEVETVKQPLDRISKCLGDPVCVAGLKRCVAAAAVRRGKKTAEEMKEFFQEQMESRTDLFRKCLAEAEELAAEKEKAEGP